MKEHLKSVRLKQVPSWRHPKCLQQLPASKRHEILLGGREAIAAASYVSNEEPTAENAKVRTSFNYQT